MVKELHRELSFPYDLVSGFGSFRPGMEVDVVDWGDGSLSELAELAERVNGHLS